ncbi:bacterio-opsin activator domain-containing protein [Halopiger aswanensis]|uniref:Putative DNA binding protein n=1 Tax=Halopiger aswanensis TaxID=148449 RepID=A0A3R7HHZ3_9EURY|nr:bacterio-opsin activator domain-containing protein [Halopiger aswanensis]RKD94660.1 putative DNA binding protein [Halopiger aswanensis]
MSQGNNPDDTVVEVEFTVTDARYPLVAMSDETGGDVTLIQLLPRSEGAYTIFHRVSGAPPERFLEVIEDYEGIEGRIVSGGEDAIIEVRIEEAGEFFTVGLTDAGAIPTELSSHDGTARIVAEIPSIYSASDVIEEFQAAYPDVEIVARRQKSYAVPLFQQRELYETVMGMLTSRQHEALLLAYVNGFYDWPRKTTGEELAAEMDVSATTFHEHLRSAERKLLSLLFSGR